MAATLSSPWSKPGAWALDSEQNEDELNHQHQLDLSAAAKKPEAPVADFPSLSAAVTVKPKKKSKQVLSLAEFSNYKPPSATNTAAADIVLPTGPRERTAEELAESRRGGFRSYGDSNRERPRASRDGFEGNSSRDMGPSRADDTDDWSKTKKFSSFGPGPERETGRDMGPSRADEVEDWSRGKKFGGGFGGGGGDRGERREKVGFFNSSRADEVDNWGSNKGFGSAAPPVEDRRRERRVGFEATGPGSDVDNWVRNKDVGVGGGGGRPKLNLQPRTLPVANTEVDSNGNSSGGEAAPPAAEGGKPKGNPFGAARPREEVLKEKGLDWKEIDEKLEAPVVSNGNLSGGEVAPTPAEPAKPKGNPFGAARPREEVLKEKGQDWKEIDEKLEAVKNKEVERSSGEGFGRRRGFGLGRSEGADDRSVRAWRKPDSPANGGAAAAAAAPPTPPSAETTENSAESTESTEKAPEEN